jgi:hypothetical protein
MVKSLGNQFLARAALADHQHRAVERRGAAGAFERVEKGGGLANYLGCALHAQALAHFAKPWQVESVLPE